MDPVSIAGGIVAFGRLAGLLVDIYNRGFSKLEQARELRLNSEAEVPRSLSQLRVLTDAQMNNTSSLETPFMGSRGISIIWRRCFTMRIMSSRDCAHERRLDATYRALMIY